MNRLLAYMIAGLVAVSLGSDANAQCANNNAVIAGGAITPACPGTTNVPCVQGGQYALVNVVTGNQYTFATCGAIFDTQITLYPGAGGIGTNVGYNDDNGVCGFFSTQSSVNWTATYTGTLRVLVDLYNCATNGTCAPLAITCAPPPPPLTNDNPCSAIALTVNQTCTMSNYTNAGATATAGVPAPGCAGYAGGDVWFTAVVPNTGEIHIETSAGVVTDGGMAAYSAAACAGPFTLMACSDDVNGLMPALDLTGLTPGQTIYIRFWEYGNNGNGTFNICAFGPSIPPGDCYYILNMYDSFGDGWDGSTVGISINGGAFTTYTVVGAGAIVYIGVNIGDILVVQYTENSAFPGDISYNLQLGGGVAFSDGPSPATGFVYSTTVDCVPPPAPPEDCVGGITVCNDQAFNNNTNNTGAVDELNTSNQGCLASGERQGTWYHFSPSSSGNIAFTISPQDATDDYDFAIWGPTPAVSCPPAGAPTRCSFAAPAGDTGLNYTATDNTEGAGGDRFVNDLTVVAGQVYTLYISNFSQTGVAFDLNWNFANGASLDCTILPIELLSFNAESKPDQITLDWTTATEWDNDHFVIERSVNGREFTAIGSVNGAGNSNEEVTYIFNDERPVFGTNYYRLKQVDHDGSYETTSTITADFGANDANIVAWPNPVQDILQLGFESMQDGQHGLLIHDPTGRMIVSETFDRQKGHCSFTIDLASLKGGLYHYQLVAPNGATLAQAHFVKK